MDYSLKIKDWSPDDRPREKLLQKGNSAVSDAELLAILLGSGTRKHSAVDIAKQILSSCNHDLHELAHKSISDLTKVRGVGQARAITILAAIELGRRRRNTNMEEKPKITSSTDAFEIVKGDLTDAPNEIFLMLLLNRANRVTRKVFVSHGGVSGTVADPRLIFKQAVDGLATSIILAHNHPSGNLRASDADIILTNQLVNAGKLFHIQVLDHLIVAGQNYISFADKGML
ncbi:MAG: DNA repair protein RadC [Bacteroidia bacterium]|nr:DNA repair protein RadC [Bacteroidia bacterium]